LERNLHKKATDMIQSQSGEARKSFFLALKLYKKERKYAIRHHNNAEIRKLYELRNNNPRQFWKILQDLKNGNAQQNHADQIPPGQWYNYLMNHNKCNIPNNPHILQELENHKNSPTFSELDFSFTSDELIKAIRKLKNNKSPGLDCISNEMIKAAKDNTNF
jgi:hypothetical protein